MVENELEVDKKEMEFYQQFNNIPGQRDILVDNHKIKILSCGLGAGKSTITAWWLIRNCLAHPKSKALLVAPTYPMLIRSSLLSVKEILSIIPEHFVKNHNKSERYFEFSNQSILFYSHGSDADAFRGIEVAFLAIDEAALLTGEAATNAMARVRQQGYPNQILFASTPRGKGNWLYKLWQNKKDNKNTKLYQWTSYDNPSLPQSYLELLETEFVKGSKLYEQEVLGKFVSFSGQVYDFKNFHDTNPPLKNFDKIYGGIDFGIADPTVCVIVARHKKEKRLYVLDEFYERGITTNEFAPICKKMQDDYGVDRFYADPSDANAIKILKNNNCRVESADNSVIPGIRAVLNHEDTITINKDLCVYTKTEAGEYEWHTDPLSKEPITSKNPKKGSDHCMDALRYCIYNGFSSSKKASKSKVSISKRTRQVRF